MRDYLEFRRYCENNVLTCVFNCETCLYEIFWEDQVLVSLTPYQVRHDFRSAVSVIETALDVHTCFET
jgi:hypothetical protein